MVRFYCLPNTPNFWPSRGNGEKGKSDRLGEETTDECTCIYYVQLYLLCFLLFVPCFCTVSFMYIYSYLLLL